MIYRHRRIAPPPRPPRVLPMEEEQMHLAGRFTLAFACFGGGAAGALLAYWLTA
jgi:hypothetical protein